MPEILNDNSGAVMLIMGHNDTDRAAQRKSGLNMEDTNGLSFMGPGTLLNTGCIKVLRKPGRISFSFIFVNSPGM